VLLALVLMPIYVLPALLNPSSITIPASLLAQKSSTQTPLTTNANLAKILVQLAMMVLLAKHVELAYS